MAKSIRGAYGIWGLLAVLIVAVAFLPTIRSFFARSFPEGFRNLDCKDVTCKEGEFCQENRCHPITWDMSAALRVSGNQVPA
jgi:hypothetical protein